MKKLLITLMTLTSISAFADSPICGTVVSFGAGVDLHRDTLRTPFSSMILKTTEGEKTYYAIGPASATILATAVALNKSVCLENFKDDLAYFVRIQP